MDNKTRRRLIEKAQKAKWDAHAETDRKEQEEYQLIAAVMEVYKAKGWEFKKEYIEKLIKYNQELNRIKEGEEK